VDSGRKEDDGTGLGLGDPGGLSSVFVNRPAMVGCVCRREGVRDILDVQVAEVWYNGTADEAGVAGLSSETSADKDKGQLLAYQCVLSPDCFLLVLRRRYTSQLGRYRCSRNTADSGRWAAEDNVCLPAFSSARLVTTVMFVLLSRAPLSVCTCMTITRHGA
jgi:hypothetical protein